MVWSDLFLELTLKMIDIEKELENAKKASIGASKLLINERENVNKILSNEGRDVKLKADLESEEIIKELNKIKKFSTIIIVTHDKKIMNFCDRIVNLDEINVSD